MSLSFSPTRDPGRELVLFDGNPIGDIIAAANGDGGFLHCFGEASRFVRLRARNWPMWFRTRAEAHEFLREAVQ